MPKWSKFATFVAKFFLRCAAKASPNVAERRISERNAKQKPKFLVSFPSESSFDERQSYEIYSIIIFLSARKTACYACCMPPPTMQQQASYSSIAMLWWS